MNTASKIHRTPALLLVASAVAMPAMADTAPAQDRVTATVQVSDLDLTRAEGQRKLERRTHDAIQTVCAKNNFLSGSRAITGAERRACEQTARADIHKQLGGNAARVAKR